MKFKFTQFLALVATFSQLALPPLRAADPVPPVAPAAPVAEAVAEPVVPSAPDAPVSGEKPKAKRSEPAGSERVHLSSDTGKPAVIVGRNFHLRAGETANEVIVVGGDAIVEGTINKKLVVVMGKMVLGSNAVVKGEVVSLFADGRLDGGAKLRDKLTSIWSKLDVGAGAEVSGETRMVESQLEADPGAVFSIVPKSMRIEEVAGKFSWFLSYLRYAIGYARPIAPGLGWVWLVAGGFFLFRMVVTLIAHKPVAATASVLSDRPLMSLLAGVLTILLIGPVAALLSFTVIGPFALFFAYWIAGIIGTAGVYCLVGQQLGRLTGLDALQNLLLSAVVGTVIIYGAYCVPILGLLVFGIVWLLSIGGAVMAASVAMQDRKSARQAATAAAIAAAAEAAPVRAVVPPNVPFESATSGSEIIPAMQLAGASAGFSSAYGSPSFSTPSAISDAALLVLPKAGFWIRVAAALLDLVLVAIVVGFMGVFKGPGVMMLFWLAYFIGMIAWKGTTIGGIICGLKVVRTDGGKMTLAVAAVRALSSFFSVFILFIGFFWIGWSSEKQGWHDIIAGTYVVKMPRSQPLI